MKDLYFLFFLGSISCVIKLLSISIFIASFLMEILWIIEDRSNCKKRKRKRSKNSYNFCKLTGRERHNSSYCSEGERKKYNKEC